MTGKPGSDLEKYYGDMKPVRSRFAGLLGPDATAFVSQSYAFAMSFASVPPEAISEMAVQLQKELAQEGVNFPVEKVEALLKKVFGSFDVEVTDSTYALFGNQLGRYVALYAQHIKNGTKADQALREFVNEFPKAVREKYQLRTTRVEGVNVHRFKLGKKLPDSAQAVFGGDDVTLAIRDDAVFLAVGADGAAKVRTARALKPQPGSLLGVEITAAGTWPLVDA